ncbi:UNVERIFIED_CONTAM: hypothetical protein FKN15_062981 [Acipenser sinensis]
MAAKRKGGLKLNAICAKLSRQVVYDDVSQHGEGDLSIQENSEREGSYHEDLYRSEAEFPEGLNDIQSFEEDKRRREAIEKWVNGDYSDEPPMEHREARVRKAIAGEERPPEGVYMVQPKGCSDEEDNAEDLEEVQGSQDGSYHDDRDSEEAAHKEDSYNSSSETPVRQVPFASPATQMTELWFSGSQHCGHLHCAYQYREHYHCLDPECNYQRFTSKQDVIRHYNMHKKRDNSLQHGFMRFSPLDDCSVYYHSCHLNGKSTHYHCMQVGCNKVYTSTSDVMTHENFHKKNTQLINDGFQRFRATEDCGTVECQFYGQKTTHFHCRRPGCTFTFKNKCDIEKHKSYHIKDDAYAKDGFKKFYKYEECKYEGCVYSKATNHFHCIRAGCGFTFTSTSQMTSHKRKHERRHIRSSGVLGLSSSFLVPKEEPDESSNDDLMDFSAISSKNSSLSASPTTQHSSSVPHMLPTPTTAISSSQTVKPTTSLPLASKMSSLLAQALPSSMPVALALSGSNPFFPIIPRLPLQLPVSAASLISAVSSNAASTPTESLSQSGSASGEPAPAVTSSSHTASSIMEKISASKGLISPMMARLAAAALKPSASGEPAPAVTSSSHTASSIMEKISASKGLISPMMARLAAAALKPSGNPETGCKYNQVNSHFHCIRDGCLFSFLLKHQMTSHSRKHMRRMLGKNFDRLPSQMVSHSQRQEEMHHMANMSSGSVGQSGLAQSFMDETDDYMDYMGGGSPLGISSESSNPDRSCSSTPVGNESSSAGNTISMPTASGAKKRFWIIEDMSPFGKRRKTASSRKMLDEGMMLEGFRRYDLYEDCKDPGCQFSLKVTHYHCTRENCGYKFCGRTHMYKHAQHHDRVDNLVLDDFKRFKSSLSCNFPDCQFSGNSTHFHCLRCGFRCTDSTKVTAHRKHHGKQDVISAAGFCQFSSSTDCEVAECKYKLKCSHFHCTYLGCKHTVVGMSQMDSHKRKHEKQERGELPSISPSREGPMAGGAVIPPDSPKEEGSLGIAPCFPPAAISSEYDLQVSSISLDSSLNLGVDTSSSLFFLKNAAGIGLNDSLDLSKKSHHGALEVTTSTPNTINMQAPHDENTVTSGDVEDNLSPEEEEDDDDEEDEEEEDEDDDLNTDSYEDSVPEPEGLAGGKDNGESFDASTNYADASVFLVC